jgi:hypothetical protein
VAENCCVAPAAILGVLGETAIPVTVFAALPDTDDPPPHPAITMHNKIWGKTNSNCNQLPRVAANRIGTPEA